MSALQEPRQGFANHVDDYEEMENEVVRAALALVTYHPKLRAIVLECTNTPPFSHAVQRATGLKVWDILSLGRWLYEAAVLREHRHTRA